MAETYVSRPHFEELTQVSEKVHVTVGIFSKKSAPFANKQGHTRIRRTAVWTPTHEPNSRLTTAASASLLA